MKSIQNILRVLVVIVTTFFYTQSNAQSLGLNNATPDASSILDLTATNRGMLVPRMTQVQRDAIVSPATALLIYQMDVIPGFYYNAGTPITPNWVPFLSTNASTAVGTGGWSLSGNSGTTIANFIGTTDNADFYIKTGTGALNIGTDAFAKTITIGNITGATNTNINSGTGGVSINVATAANTPVNIATGTTTGQVNIGNATGRVAIGTTLAPDASSILDIPSTTAGILVPRMTTAQRTGIGSPANGLLVYDTDLASFYYYDTPSLLWRSMYSSAAASSLTAWSLAGNAGIIDGTDYIGTNGAVDFTMRANLLERFRVNFDDGPEIAPLSFANSTGLKIGALSGATSNVGINIGAISGTGTASAFTTGAISSTGATAFHLNLGDISGANSTSHTGINLGNISGVTPNAYGINLGTITGGTTANYGINIGDITTTNATNSYSFKSGILSGTGATADHINLGTITGANTTSHSGITIGDISGATPNAYGLNLGTLTGGTTANYQLNLGAITSTGATNSYGLNFGGISGTGTNNYGINIGTLSSTGVSTGINIAGLSGAGTTNTGLLIGTISGGTINNLGLRVTGTAVAATNYGLYVDAPAQNYLEGQVGIGTNAPTAGRKLDVRGTIIGAVPVVAIAHFGDDVGNGDDDFFSIMVASVPSTNEVWVRTTISSTVNDNALDNTANWTAWTNFGQPSGAAGSPYIMSISVSTNQNNPSSDDCHALISVRMSDGTVYVRTTTADNTAAASMDNTASWDAWANFGSPGM